MDVLLPLTHVCEQALSCLCFWSRMLPAWATNLGCTWFFTDPVSRRFWKQSHVCCGDLRAASLKGLGQKSHLEDEKSNPAVEKSLSFHLKRLFDYSQSFLLSMMWHCCRSCAAGAFARLFQPRYDVNMGQPTPCSYDMKPLRGTSSPHIHPDTNAFSRWAALPDTISPNLCKIYCLSVAWSQLLPPGSFGTTFLPMLKWKKETLIYTLWPLIQD